MTHMQPQNNYLLVTLDGGGNLPPVLAVATELQSRGHRITVLSEPCLEALMREKGFDFRAFTGHFSRSDRHVDIFHDTKKKGLKDPVLENVVFGPAEELYRQSLAALADLDQAVLLADCLLPPAVIAAQQLGRPSVLLFHFPEYLPGRNRPPGVLGLTPGRTWPGKMRDRLLSAAFHMVLDGYKPSLNQLCARAGLPPLKSTAELLHRATRRLLMTLRDFDFPLQPAPPNLRYTGPVLDLPDWSGNHPAGPAQNRWPEASTGSKKIAVALSSTFQNQTATLEQIAAAIGQSPHSAVITTGPAIDPAAITPQPGVHICQTADHDALFCDADLVITHAGHGTVMRALAHGCPLLCMPFGRDQKDNTAKVRYHKLGKTLPKNASAYRIKKSIVTVLNNPGYAHNALTFKSKITQNPGAILAANEIENINTTD